MENILLIDDDPELADLLGGYLDGEGFRLDTAFTGKAGLEIANANSHRLILLDVMLPDMSGFNVLSALRTQHDVPVVMLTGRGEEIDRVVGLEMGADDYVAKPFQLRELLARIRAVLRRYGATSVDEVPDGNVKPKKGISFGDAFLDRNSRQVSVNNNPIHLTSTEYDILELLVLNMGRVVERGVLMENALGRGEDYDDYVLNVHMSNLRRKLGQSVGIKTIRGRGYLLVVVPGEGD